MGLASGSARTLVFVHGWPDTPEVFSRQIAHFEKEFRIVTLTLPGYRGEATPFFGHSFEDTATMIAASVKEAMHGRAEKPILVCHDWGAALATLIMYREPDLFERAVMIDIGCHVGTLPLSGTLMTLAYQWTLLILFLLPRFIADPLTRAVAAVLRVPKEARAKAHAKMNYLYLRLWHRIVTGNVPVPLKTFCVPKLPLLFLYGEKKPFMFHSQRFIKHLKDTPGSDAIGFPSDHWFFARNKCASDANAAIERFVKARL